MPAVYLTELVSDMNLLTSDNRYRTNFDEIFINGIKGFIFIASLAQKFTDVEVISANSDRLSNFSSIDIFSLSFQVHLYGRKKTGLLS